jgi:hypothetical protein
MSCPAANITGFNKSKDDFVWFAQKATKDRKRDAHAELYKGLLKMFMDADTDKDGLSFLSKLIDMAAPIHRMNRNAPVDSELHKTENKELARQNMFDSMDEWYKFSMEHILAKMATLEPHPIRDHGNLKQFKTFPNAALAVGSTENNEFYWFLLELFTENNNDTDGIVQRNSINIVFHMV